MSHNLYHCIGEKLFRDKYGKPWVRVSQMVELFDDRVGGVHLKLRL